MKPRKRSVYSRMGSQLKRKKVRGSLKERELNRYEASSS